MVYTYTISVNHVLIVFFTTTKVKICSGKAYFVGQTIELMKTGGGCFCVIHCISFLVSDKSGRRFYSDFLSQEAGLNIILL